MKIEKIINEIAQENTYLLSNATSCLVIDPGSQPQLLLERLRQLDKPVKAILLTHAHFDHIIGLESLKNDFPDAPILLHEAERDWPKSPELNASSLLLGQAVIAPDADEFYHINHVYDLDGFEFVVRATPGHSIGGVSFVFTNEKLVFTGDALFAGSIGRWDLPTGSYEQLIYSIKTELLALPDDFQVLAGHGEATTIGHERQFNPFL